ncbi:hypothetical protein JL722_15039 [Aureococcus anophagefferens]|nr:hypothetical protein JL722_15039 [Aureococcus anophagefferens]
MGGESGWDVMKGFDGLPKLPEWESIQQKLDEAKAKSLEGMAAARKTSIELGAVAAVNASSLKTRLAPTSKTLQRGDNFKSAAHDPRSAARPAQRFKWYVALLMVAAAFFSTALNFLPLVVIKPAKFATAFCIGTVASHRAKFMLNGRSRSCGRWSRWKLPYTLALFASTALTLYACFGLGNFVAIRNLPSTAMTTKTGPGSARRGPARRARP